MIFNTITVLWIMSSSSVESVEVGRMDMQRLILSVNLGFRLWSADTRTSFHDSAITSVGGPVEIPYNIGDTLEIYADLLKHAYNSRPYLYYTTQEGVEPKGHDSALPIGQIHERSITTFTLELFDDNTKIQIGFSVPDLPILFSPLSITLRLKKQIDIYQRTSSERETQITGSNQTNFNFRCHFARFVLGVSGIYYANRSLRISESPIIEDGDIGSRMFCLNFETIRRQNTLYRRYYIRNVTKYTLIVARKDLRSSSKSHAIHSDLSRFGQGGAIIITLVLIVCGLIIGLIIKVCKSRRSRPEHEPETRATSVSAKLESDLELEYTYADHADYRPHIETPQCDYAYAYDHTIRQYATSGPSLDYAYVYDHILPVKSKLSSRSVKPQALA